MLRAEGFSPDRQRALVERLAIFEGELYPDFVLLWLLCQREVRSL